MVIVKMPPSLDFEDCLKDSPKFRANLESAELDIDQLELKLEKVVRQCRVLVDAGKIYYNANRSFVTEVRELSGYFKPADNEVSELIGRTVQSLEELQNFLNILLDQAQRSICKNLDSFIRDEIRKVKDTKKVFEKISDDLDAGLVRNSAASKYRPVEGEEAHSLLTAMSSCFAHTALDYVFQINVLHSRKQYQVLDILLSFLHAQSVYFHQGHDFFEHSDCFLKQTGLKIAALRNQAECAERRMEERHSLVQKKSQVLSIPATPKQRGEIRMEGYLFKRTSNAFKAWHRRWFTVQHNQLVYRKRTKDTVTVMEEDLRLCTVKPCNEIERRFCFEVVSPTKSHILQSDTDVLCRTWIDALTESIGAAFRDTLHPSESAPSLSAAANAKPSCTPNGRLSTSDSDPTLDTTVLPKPAITSLWQQVLSIPGNERCCDCQANEPRWASINLGTTLCIECSGIHRSLGVHVSKVRSLTLDAWDPEILQVMHELGNVIVNSVYEANVNETKVKRATPDSNRAERELWIQAKYVQRSFVTRLPTATTDGGMLQRGAFKRWSVRKLPKRAVSRSNARDNGTTTKAGDGLHLEALKMAPPSGSGDSVEASSNHESVGVAGSSPPHDVGYSTELLVFGTPLSIDRLTTDLEVDSSSCESINSYSTVGSDSLTAGATVADDMSSLTPDLLLYRAAAARNLPVILEALAKGGKLIYGNQNDNGQLPLHQAVRSGSIAACEFLLQNGAKIDSKDSGGQTALHLATSLCHTGQVY
ncbi:PREDICTED: arf-GAP with coiled-coil, ANK repeat and PH domain-containing protein 3-like [Priapulus caudatus]|uniref:Arf-GAP with coiled-coil, ANK repeat and PH domain-containing protein 3-like n=1 Tax=Priapulus caudatus TaxID=37621 RepID=A0ABM1EBL5_PRICU|nr:PREDICTED: arf-GAP with coiled-coil, ANK repeat and PH domain-containing protein 3-like [Priapulus caudatus]